MRNFLRTLSVAAAVAAAAGVVACGGGGGGSSFTAGSGSITITTFSPNPVIGCAPTAFTITGSGFQTVTGTTALVTFTATGGATPFSGSSVATVVGNVTSDTTITGTTPAVTICGVASFSATIDVTLESGVKASTTGGAIVVTFNAPTVTAIAPNPIPAAIPTALVVTGTGFGSAGAQATVRFVSANLGDLNFVDGTADSVDVQGTVATSTTITLESPLARACTANFTASVQVILGGGTCCTVPTANTFVTFLAPTVAGGFGVSSLVPTALVLGGTNLGVAGETATIRLTTSGGQTIFNNGASQQVDIPGIVGAGGTSVAFTTPVTALCGPTAPSVLTTLRYTAPRGSSCATGPSVTFSTNVITLANGVVSLAVNALQQPLTAVTFTFSSPLPAIGTPVTLVYASTTLSGGTPLPIFNDGSAAVHSTVGVVASATTVTGVIPLATLCGVDTANASVTANWPGGSCSTSAANVIVYQAPSLTTLTPGGIQNNLIPVANFPNNNIFAFAGQEPFTLTAAAGRNFGPTGAVVSVRFSTAGNNIWQGGSRDYDTAIGQVASSTTITGSTPATVALSGAATVTVQAFFEDGSCTSNTASAVFTLTTQRTFALGTGGFFTVNQNGAGAPALIGGVVATPAANTQVGMAVDARKNLLVTPIGDNRLWNTAPTTAGVPTVPVSGTSIAIGGATGDVALAPDLNIGWASNSGSSQIWVFNERNGGTAGVPVVPPLQAVRIYYNQPSREMVIFSSPTAQIALYNAQSNSIDAIFAIPPIVVTGTATWNGVGTIRPGTASTRAYMVYDDPTNTNDEIGTIAFSTGVITSINLGPGTWVSAANPNAMAFDTIRSQLVWWHATVAAVNLERRNSDTLAAVLAIATAAGSNFTSISTDGAFSGLAGDDRYYASDNALGQVVGINGATLVSVGSVAVPAAGGNASTSP